MSNLRCRLLDDHDFERVTDWWPVVGSPHSGWNDTIRVLALGRCRRKGCGKLKARTVYGTHEWGYRTGKREVTPAQAVSEWRAELAQNKVAWDFTSFTAEDVFDG